MTTLNARQSAVIEAAREWMGTPWRHQGRVRGVGVDCGGLVIEAFKACGVLPPGFDVGQYGRNPDLPRIISTLSQWASEADDILPGDVLLFTIVDAPRHLAIATDIGMIHAYQGLNCVTEHVIDKRWRRRLYKIFRPVALWQP